MRFRHAVFVVVVVVCASAACCSCATSVDHRRLDSAAVALELPASFANDDELIRWWRDVADPRDSSFDLQAPTPSIETALGGAGGVTRVGFLLAKSPWRATAVVAWLAPTTVAPKGDGVVDALLWGLPLRRTDVADEFYVADIHAVVRLIDKTAALPRQPRIQIVDDVNVKTRTRTFHNDHLYALQDGRIWFKRSASNGGTAAEPWRLFLSGVPAAFQPRDVDEMPFRTAEPLVGISADGDDLVAVDASGFVYLCTTRSTSWGSSSGWSDGWGFPGKRPLHIDGRAAGARSWAIGRRAEHALWFEDAIGNRQHMGPMGTSTLYVLHHNGQQILFTDNGLPNDFSRDLCGPDDGRFIAERLDASASAIVVVDGHGRVLSRFEDYDLNGGTPNFEYTYRSEVRADDDPTSMFSSIKPYFLPLAPWLWHTPLTLTGKARMSRVVSVHQTGVGNAARTIRIAGDDVDGRRGFYETTMDIDFWSFVADDSVEVADADWLKGDAVAAGAADFVTAEGDIARSRLPRGNGFRAQWRGTIDTLVDSHGVDIAPIAASLDFNPHCPPHRMTIHVPVGAAVVDVGVTLHSVDLWMPARRGSPGIDGTQLMLLGTLVFDDDVLTDRRPAVRRVIEGIRGYHHDTFSLLLSMDAQTLKVAVVDEDDALKHPLAMTFAPTTPMTLPTPALGLTPRTLAFFLSPQLEALPMAAPLLANTPAALQANVALRDTLRSDFDELKRPVRELEAFVDQPLSALTPVMRLGRVPKIPRLLRLVIEAEIPALHKAEARYRAVDELLGRRIAALQTTLGDPVPLPISH